LYHTETWKEVRMKKLLLGVTLALVSISSVKAQEGAKNRSNSDDIPNYPLMWEYPKMDFNKKTKKEFIAESETAYKARLPRAQKWTKSVYETISRETSLADMKASQVDDVDFYCPNYGNMTRRQKIVFWGQFIAAISYKESSWNPATRTLESLADFPNPDSVTGKRVYSEGLLQLSYQDGRNYGEFFKCGFDWNNDRKLDPKSPEKTILSATRNLRCGILILNKRVTVNNRITTPGQYWSVIRPRAINKFSATPWISMQTKKLPFCNTSVFEK
jgi:hypothetical protein